MTTAMHDMNEKKEGGAGGLAHFIKYNNAVPIALGALFFATTATFAATPAAQEAIYSSTTTTRSIDNSYLLSVDLERYPFSMRVTSVTEDGEYYYLAYDFDTIDVVDGVWRDVTQEKTLRISKALLAGGDMRVYAESELAQVKAGEGRRLTETKAYEKRLGTSQKVVATTYKGLVGKFITPSEVALPPYAPPPAEQDEDSPLAISELEPLITWDANVAGDNDEEGSQTGAEGRSHIFTDLCPNTPGIQLVASECPSQDAGDGATDAPEPDEGDPTPASDPAPEAEPPAPTPEPAPEPGTP